MAGRTTVRVTVDRDGLRHLTHSPAGPVGLDLRRRGRNVGSRAKVLAPVNTGRLRSSITETLTTVGGEPAVRIGTNVEHALFVHDGTGIYGPRGRPIEPVTARRLSWQPRGGGRRIYARRVAGMPGRPFLRNALPAAGQ